MKMPAAHVYEGFFRATPWKHMADRVIRHVVRHAPRNGQVLDAMCGPGWIINQIKRERPDLTCTGVDENRAFIHRARDIGLACTFVRQEIRYWIRRCTVDYDVVICTGGIHHVPYNDQFKLIRLLAQCVKNDGFLILGDPHLQPMPDVDMATREVLRLRSVIQLGCAYVKAAIDMGATSDILRVTTDIMITDARKDEYKVSVADREKVLRDIFRSAKKHRTWSVSKRIPDDAGDYYFVCRGRRR